MSQTIITVEGLGKRYLLRHQRERYATLRDVVAEKVTSLFRASGANGATVSTQEEFWALRDISFEVKQGEVLGIIGRNGAGKSTLLKILSRITDPTEGRIKIKGRVASLLEVGTGFHPELTGRENIFLNGAILGMTKAEIKAKFDEIVAFAETEKFLDTPVKRYSSGMYVRLAFAVAAHLEPEILVVDEVLAVGDAEFQRKCLRKMQDVARQDGRTILFVSHNLAQIEKLSNRALLLIEGKLTVNASPEETIRTYLQTREQQFGTLALSQTELNAPLYGVRLHDFEVRAEHAEVIRTGCVCRLAMAASFDQTMRNPGFIFSIRTLGGVELIRISTSPISGVDTGICYGEVRCALRIEELPLAAGSYEIAAGLSIPNVDYVIPLTNIGRFVVETADVYRSGFAIDNKFGVIIARHNWDVKHLSASKGSETTDLSIKPKT